MPWSLKPAEQSLLWSLLDSVGCLSSNYFFSTASCSRASPVARWLQVLCLRIEKHWLTNPPVNHGHCGLVRFWPWLRQRIQRRRTVASIFARLPVSRFLCFLLRHQCRVATFCFDYFCYVLSALYRPYKSYTGPTMGSASIRDVYMLSSLHKTDTCADIPQELHFPFSFSLSVSIPPKYALGASLPQPVSLVEKTIFILNTLLGKALLGSLFCPRYSKRSCSCEARSLSSPCNRTDRNLNDEGWMASSCTNNMGQTAT